MKFVVAITVYDKDDNLQSDHRTVMDYLPTPEELEGLVLLVIADGVSAVATVHVGSVFTSPLYGIVSEVSRDG